MSDDVEASKYDIGTTSIKLIRAGSIYKSYSVAHLRRGFCIQNYQKDINALKTN
jgi:hypothetical protein